jgi:glycosyltransferase involved in cell wall biosynthesis
MRSRLKFAWQPSQFADGCRLHRGFGGLFTTGDFGAEDVEMLLDVSVVIPAYRAARTVCRAVDSVLAQSAPAAEIIVVDDGSPDDLPGVLVPYGNRVTLIRKNNGGAASARNAGIDQARGAFIAFLDADDYWEPHKLKRQLQTFQAHSSLGLVASSYYEQAAGQCTRHVINKPASILDRVMIVDGKEAFALATQIWTGTVVVRRDVLGEHRFCTSLETAEDRDLWLRLLVAAPLYYLSQPLATAVLEPNSLSRSNIDRDCSNMLRIVHRYEALLGESGVRRWEADVFKRWAANHLGAGDARSALAPALQRLKRQPISTQAWWIALKSLALACLPKQT